MLVSDPGWLTVCFRPKHVAAGDELPQGVAVERRAGRHLAGESLLSHRGWLRFAVIIVSGHALILRPAPAFGGRVAIDGAEGRHRTQQLGFGGARKPVGAEDSGQLPTPWG